MKSVIIVSIFLALLTACSSGGSPKLTTETFDDQGGTSSYSDRSGAAFMFVFDLDEAPAEDVQVSVLGPNGWNDGAAARRVFQSLEAGRTATWVNIFRDTQGNLMDIVSGEYVVQTVLSGKTYRRIVNIETQNTLGKSANVAAIIESATSVNVTWNEVSSASSYLVRLTPVGDAEISGDTFVYTRDNAATLDGLTLDAGAEYKVGVTALTAGFAEGSKRAMPAGAFNTAYASTTLTTP